MGPPPYKGKRPLEGEPQFDRGGFASKRYGGLDAGNGKTGKELVLARRRGKYVEDRDLVKFAKLEQWPALSSWSGPVAAHVDPTVKAKVGETKNYRQLSRAAAIATTLSAVKTPHNDLRWHGKVRPKYRHNHQLYSPERMDALVARTYRDRDKWSPSPSVQSKQLAERYGFVTPQTVNLKAALKQFDRWRARVGFPEDVAGSWRICEIVGWEKTRYRKREWPTDKKVKIKGAKASRILPKAGEHGGNIIRLASGKLVRGADGRHTADPGYDKLENCVTDEASLAFANRFVPAGPCSKYETSTDWDELARRARDGCAESYNNLLVAARPRAEMLAKKYRSHGPHLDVDDLTTEGLLGNATSGVRYAVDNWNETKGPFLPILSNAIKWAINAELKRVNKETHIPLSAPLNKGSQQALDVHTFEELMAENITYDEFDYATAGAKLDERLAGLSEREHRVITQRHCLDGTEVVPTLEELGAEIGRSRETIRKIEIAAEQKIGLRR